MAFNPKCSVGKGFAMRESGLQNGDDFIKPNSGQNWLGQARTAASTQESCNILKYNSAHSTGSTQVGPWAGVSILRYFGRNLLRKNSYF